MWKVTVMRTGLAVLTIDLISFWLLHLCWRKSSFMEKQKNNMWYLDPLQKQNLELCRYA
jgi:hypothetical protein